MGELTAAEEATLLADFHAGSPDGELRFASALRPLFAAEVRHRWPRFGHLQDDFCQDAILAVWQRRKKGERFEPPLAKLVHRFIAAPGIRFAREARRRGRERVDQLPDSRVPQLSPTQEIAAEMRELQALIAQLPELLSSALWCHAAHVEGHGPPLHEALGVTVDVANKRLVRAQAAIQALARPGLEGLGGLHD